MIYVLWLRQCPHTHIITDHVMSMYSTPFFLAIILISFASWNLDYDYHIRLLKFGILSSSGWGHPWTRTTLLTVCLDEYFVPFITSLCIQFTAATPTKFSWLATTTFLFLEKRHTVAIPFAAVQVEDYFGD